MSSLSSRPSASPATTGALSLDELISHTGVRVTITEDRSVDPAVLTVIQEAVRPYPEELILIKRLADPLTLGDLIKVIDRLGYPIDYEELK